MCQLKKDIAEERLTCSANTECMLAAYALQAEMGDFDSEEYHEEGYIQQCAWFCDVVSLVELYSGVEESAKYVYTLNFKVKSVKFSTSSLECRE